MRALKGLETMIGASVIHWPMQRIADYPHLSRYVREIYRMPGVADTVNVEHIKRHYYESHRTINPTGIVPAGPVLDFAVQS